jgi:hypothetical protein
MIGRFSLSGLSNGALNRRCRGRSRCHYLHLGRGSEGLDTTALTRIGATVAAFGIVGACIDFSLGRSGRKRVKEQLADWWFKLSTLQWRSFGREEVKFAVQKMDDIFGSFFSRRRLIILLMLFLCGIIFLYVPLLCDTNTELLLSRSYDFRYYTLIILTLIMSIVMFSISISFTRNISSFLAFFLPNSVIASVIEFSLVVFMSFVLLCYLGGVSLYIVLTILYTAKLLIAQTVYFAHWGSFIDWDIFKLFADNLFDPSRFSINYVFNSLFKIDNYCGDIKTVGLAFSHILSIFINVGRVLLSLAFLLSFLLCPIRDFLVGLLERLDDSDTPVFTLVLGGVAAVRKSIEEIAKAFS